jgi:S-formylglutathione hydrolase FrmB
MVSKLTISKATIHAASLESNYLGDPTSRDITLISYNFHEESPILIGLAGFFGSSLSFLNRSYSSQDFISTLERMCSSSPEISFMIALPDSMTSIYGNQYINSSYVGNYEDFITKDLVGYLEKTYGKRKLGIFGKSSGGFGAYNLTIRNPELFSGFVDVSGDSAFEYCYVRDFPYLIETIRKESLEAFLEKFRKIPTHSRPDLNAIGILAMAAFYSPSKKEKGKIDLPFDLDTGLLDRKTWNRWIKHDPARNIKSNLGSLRNKKTILQVGKHNEFSMNIGIRSMHETLRLAGIDHEYNEYDEGHFSIDYLYEYSLPALLSYLKNL